MIRTVINVIVRNTNVIIHVGYSGIVGDGLKEGLCEGVEVGYNYKDDDYFVKVQFLLPKSEYPNSKLRQILRFKFC